VVCPAPPTHNDEQALLCAQVLLFVLGSLLGIPAAPAPPLAPPSVRAPAHGLGGTGPEESAAGGAPEKMPLVLFSHGLGGTRTAYAWHCCALASSGRLVAALEHSDETACVTRVPAAAARGSGRERKQGAWLRYAGCGVGARRWSKVRLRNTIRRHDAHHTHAACVASVQVAHRCAEMSLTLDALLALSQHGDADAHADAAAHAPRHVTRVTWPASPRVPLGAPSFLAQFRGRIDADALVSAGHSFGGASAVSFARADARIAACVAYDPWLVACPPADAAAAPWAHPVALCMLLCEPWAQRMECGGPALRRVVAAARAGGGDASVAALAHTTHHSFADPSALLPPALGERLRRGLAPATPPARAFAATFALTDAFLRAHTGPRRTRPEDAAARKRAQGAAAAAPVPAAARGHEAEEEARPEEYEAAVPPQPWADAEHAAMVARTLEELNVPLPPW
jgi:platelet-activating factor acetylhydrolase